MDLISALPPAYAVWFYGMLAIVVLYALLVFIWQIRILRGKTMTNPDGSTDGWHEQASHFGMAVADVFLACPMCIASVVLVLINHAWGLYLLGMTGFWFVWTNTMTTVTSLRFHAPRLNIQWCLTFPFGIVVGLAVTIWPLAVVSVIGFPGSY